MLDIDTFGEMMDEFLKKMDVKMLIHLPEDTLEATVSDNIGAGSMLQLYFLHQAFASVGKKFQKDMELANEDWEEVVNELTGMLKDELLEAKG